MGNPDEVLDTERVCRLEVGDTAGWKPALRTCGAMGIRM